MHYVYTSLVLTLFGRHSYYNQISISANSSGCFKVACADSLRATSSSCFSVPIRSDNSLSSCPVSLRTYSRREVGFCASLVAGRITSACFRRSQT